MTLWCGNARPQGNPNPLTGGWRMERTWSPLRSVYLWGLRTVTTRLFLKQTLTMINNRNSINDFSFKVSWVYCCFGPLWLSCMAKNSWNILQNIFFLVPHLKENDTGLDWHHFLVNYTFKSIWKYRFSTKNTSLQIISSVSNRMHNTKKVEKRIVLILGYISDLVTVITVDQPSSLTSWDRCFKVYSLMASL